MKDEHIGEKYGKLTIIKRLENVGYHKYYLCQCDCGSQKRVRYQHLKDGKIKSCTCIRKAMITTHNMCHTRLNNIWRSMKQRCLNIKNTGYSYYGGRGIKICDEWLNDFQAFYNWAINNGYEEHLTLDRINTNGNYEPSNCRWVTKKEQANNTRKNRIIFYNDEVYTLSQLAEKLKVNKKSLGYRLDHNLPLRGKYE